MWDVTCPDTYRRGWSCGAERAEHVKISKYAHLDSSHYFIQVAVETLGMFGPEALSFFQDLSQHLRQVTGEPRKLLLTKCTLHCIICFSVCFVFGLFFYLVFFYIDSSSVLLFSFLWYCNYNYKGSINQSISTFFLFLAFIAPCIPYCLLLVIAVN